MRRVAKKVSWAVVGAVACVVAVVGVASPAAASPSPSISCTTSQNGRTITFSCYVNTTARYYMSVDCFSWTIVASYTKVWRGTLNGPGWYTYSMGCPLSYQTLQPGWGVWT